MAVDPVTGHVLMFNSQHGETWLYETGGSSRPAHVFGVSFGAAQARADRVVTDIEVRWVGGGLGHPDGIATPGAVLSVWDGKRWREAAANTTASPSATADITWTLSEDSGWDARSPGERDVLLVGPAQTLYLALTPTAPGGAGTDLGAVATDYVEATVRYRLP